MLYLNANSPKALNNSLSQLGINLGVIIGFTKLFSDEYLFKISSVSIIY